jgi:hypothetical protein
MNRKNKNIRDIYKSINEYKKICQPRSNLVEDEEGDLLADPLNILSRWKYHFSHLLNAPGVSDIRQIEINRAEPLVPQHSPCKVKLILSSRKGINRQIVGQVNSYICGSHSGHYEKCLVLGCDVFRLLLACCFMGYPSILKMERVLPLKRLKV